MVKVYEGPEGPKPERDPGPAELDQIGMKKRAEAEQASGARQARIDAIRDARIARENADHARGGPVAGHADPEHEHCHGRGR